MTRSAMFYSLLLALTLSRIFGEDAENLWNQLEKTKSPQKALALAQLGEPAVPFLVKGLQRGDRVAALCAWALAEHPQPSASGALRDLLPKVDQVAGYWAAKALAKSPSPENISALAALLPLGPNSFWELSGGGKPRLQDQYDPKGNRYTAEAPAGMPNIRVAYATMEALGQIGGDVAAATLLRALENDQYLIRHAAARALGQLKHQPSSPVLSRLAEKDPVLMVRLASRDALKLLAGETLKVPAKPALPPSIAFIKTRHRSDATFGFRDSYFFPKTPRFHSGDNLFTLTPPRPDGTLRNLTELTDGEVQGPEVSTDGRKIIFAMRRNRHTDGFHIFEINTDGTGLRQVTSGNCNDVDPVYLPDGRIAFCSDRAGYQEYYHQERSRLIYVMNADGSAIQQITFNPNQDYEPSVLRDGRLVYSSYRFYAQDGSEGPLPGEFMGLARIETVLRACNPDGAADQLFYGSMRGSFYCPLRPMPFGDQFAGWHKRGYHVGVSVSHQREMPDGMILCTTPAGLTLVDPDLAPVDCELPIYPEVLNLAGGEEVYIHNYDEMNPVGRYTTPYPAGDGWAFVSHAPWHDLRVNGYGLYLMNLVTRELEVVYDDPQMSDVDPIVLAPQPPALVRSSTLAKTPGATGLIVCNSVYNSDVPYNKDAVRYVRVLEGMQMGQSINANAAFRTRVLGTAPIHEDGSFYIEVPADVPVRFELLDSEGRMLVHETEFNYVRPGETKGCVGCHEPRQYAAPGLKPKALEHPPARALRDQGDLIYMGRRERSYNTIFRD